MSQHPWHVRLSLSVLLVGAMASAAITAEPQSDAARRITYDDLKKMTVVGRLGEPIGTFVTIEGSYSVPKGITKAFDYEIDITSVNGKSVKLKISYEDVEWEPYLDDHDLVRNQSNFRLIGYERLAYSGYVAGEGKFDSRHETYQRPPREWGLHSVFHVLANKATGKHGQAATTPDDKPK